MQFVPVRYQGSELTAHLLVESPRKDLGTRRNFPVSPLSRFRPLLLLHGSFSWDPLLHTVRHRTEVGGRSPNRQGETPWSTALPFCCVPHPHLFREVARLLGLCVALMETQAFKYLIYLFNTLEVKFIPSLFMLCLGGRAGWDLQELVPPKIADTARLLF